MVDAFRDIIFPNDAKVLIVGTKATISSGVYLSILDEKRILSSVFTPSTLAGDIEKNDLAAIEASIFAVLRQASGFTHIVLACTHYPLVLDVFKKEALQQGWVGEFVDPALCVARRVERWNLCGSRKITFETSKETEAFREYSGKSW